MDKDKKGLKSRRLPSSRESARSRLGLDRAKAKSKALTISSSLSSRCRYPVPCLALPGRCSDWQLGHQLRLDQHHRHFGPRFNARRWSSLLHSPPQRQVSQPVDHQVAQRLNAHYYCPRAAKATSTPGASSLDDPQMVAAQQALDEGTLALEQGDFEQAEKMYQKSLDVKETAIGQCSVRVKTGEFPRSKS